MNTSGDAAEQMVRLSLNGMEVAVKLTGSGMKNLAAALLVIAKNYEKMPTKGRARLESMLKADKPLTTYYFYCKAERFEGICKRSKTVWHCIYCNWKYQCQRWYV